MSLMLLSATQEHLHDDSDGRCTEKVAIRLCSVFDETTFTVTVHKNAAPISDGDVIDALQSALNHSRIANGLPLLTSGAAVIDSGTPGLDI